ncbi:hypothetical protein [Lentzea sp. NBRC 105346]|uniref:hypothetical protein n=1 Tax=Lentzea sp. NBRC 105346 TaxID=3032205 RepID=UPI0025535F26|nr:hypothetical protein [Lentzea sp. NBRC 105346]
MQAMTDSAKQLSAAASSGGFKVSKEGAQAYISALQKAIDDVRGMDLDLLEIQQETKLGTSPDGQTLSRYNNETALGGAGTAGLVPAIDQLKTALDDAKAAMEAVLRNYENVDSSNASSFKAH